MKYKLFGKSGLRVSEVCLGTMTFGEDWGWGAPKDTCRELLKIFLDRGGNFIDTANHYTNGNSEKIVGELTEGIRDRLVIATKYSLMTDQDNINAGGNQRKNMMMSVEQSLNRLRTDYIDIYWLHIWDKFTPVEEVMRGLDDLISSGKVHYIGVSDTPAWVVSKANTLAEMRGWNRFNAIQVEYNLVERGIERELLPMAEAEGMATLAWSPLAGGLLSGKYNSNSKTKSNNRRLKEDNIRLTKHNLKIADTLIEVAKEMKLSPSTVALLWVKAHKNVIPIIGARKTEQLVDNLQCIDNALMQDFLERLNEVSKITYGFPMDFIDSPGVQDIVYGPFKNEILI